MQALVKTAEKTGDAPEAELRPEQCSFGLAVSHSDPRGCARAAMPSETVPFLVKLTRSSSAVRRSRTHHGRAQSQQKERHQQSRQEALRSSACCAMASAQSAASELDAEVAAAGGSGASGGQVDDSRPEKRSQAGE